MSNEEIPKDNNEEEEKKEPYHDDHFLGHHDDILPKTFKTEEAEELLKRRAFSQEDEIKKIKDLTNSLVGKEIGARYELLKKEIDKIFNEYEKSSNQLRKQAELLPKSQEYEKFSKEVPNSIKELEQTFKGSIRRFLHLFAFGTERGWWNKAAGIIKAKHEERKLKFIAATEEQKAWLKPRLEELERKREEALNKIYTEAFSKVGLKEFQDWVLKELKNQEKIQKELRDPKDSQTN